MLLGHLCFFSFLFFALLFVHIPFFTFAPMPCCLLCCIRYCCWFVSWLLRVNGKRSCLCWVSWFNKKKEEALYVFGHAFFGFLWEVGLTAVGSCWWSRPSRVCGKGGNFLYIWARKGSVHGVLEGWNSGTFCICYVTFFLFYLICLYWIVLKNSQCYCPLYLDR